LFYQVVWEEDILTNVLMIYASP